ncbi:hypothetical protein [Clostridium grantii]|uniref:Xylose isomerase-like TIM barrel n=1 Tax=Clostridium grantii DSM 8605 TaxID=1121316 RepID=A0A1M5UBG5_9CLOT|nr:hypothetical protein [Clostridium grantii]SHH60309.1 hypothetical protein SAMN02745207_01690 [Clostridium grantii DSM 8605]
MRIGGSIVKPYENREEWIKMVCELKYSTVSKHIKSVHLKDIKLVEGFPIHLQECSPGKGDIDLEKVLRLCAGLGNEISLFVEHMATHEEYKEAVSYLRTLAKKYDIDIV